MAKNQRQPGVTQLAVEDMQIGAADAAGAHREQELIGSGAWSRHFAQAQRRALGMEKHRLHGSLPR